MFYSKTERKLLAELTVWLIVSLILALAVSLQMFKMHALQSELYYQQSENKLLKRQLDVILESKKGDSKNAKEVFRLD